MTYQHAVVSSLGKTGRQLCTLQLSLTLPYIKHSDRANHFLQPASITVLHQCLDIKLGVRQRVHIKVR